MAADGRGRAEGPQTLSILFDQEAPKLCAGRPLRALPAMAGGFWSPPAPWEAQRSPKKDRMAMTMTTAPTSQMI